MMAEERGVKGDRALNCPGLSRNHSLLTRQLFRFSVEAEERRSVMEWITNETVRFVLACTFGFGAISLLCALLWSVAMWFLPAEQWEEDAMTETFGR